MVPVGGVPLLQPGCLYMRQAVSGGSFYLPETRCIMAYIDMALQVVSKLPGKPAADEMAQYMQYEYWKQG
jgi:hypothetical protein